MTETRAVACARTRPVSTALRLAFAVSLTVLAFSTHASANPSLHVRKPTDTSLARLEQYEPYIAYFTSLSYGPLNSTVTPNYVRALILTESAAQKFAVSNKGARGLTQIMPETGRLAARDIVESGFDFRYIEESRLVRYNPDMLYDPAINILIACYLGAQYHADYSGRTDLVAAAWNAGPYAVARYGMRTPPYQETRGMVHRLVGYLNYFQTASPDTRPATFIPAIASRYTDLSHQRWDTDGWNHPGWDEKKVIEAVFR
jgi:soluble lytic murein transglycosylase-like protein